MMDFLMSLLGDEFLSKAFILSMLTSVLYILKGIPKIIWKRIRRLVIFSVTIEYTDELFDYVERWLKDNHEKKYRNVLANVNYRNFALNDDGYKEEPLRGVDVTESKDRKEEVSYRHNEDIIFIRRGKVIIKINKGREKLENAKTAKDLYFDKYFIEVFFFKSRVLDFLNEVVVYNQQFKFIGDNAVSVWGTSYDSWNKLRTLNSKSVDNIILPKGVKETILEDAVRFNNNKEWYISRCILYKRGYLFYGDPGNGKTTFAVALAYYLKKDIYTFSLSGIFNDEALKTLFRRVPDNSVILLEDVDADFKKSRNSDNGITFSTLLNCIDGVHYKEGVIIIMTTNHIEKLDPALIRDGRVDLKIEFTTPEENQVKEYYELFFNVRLNGEKLNMKPKSMAQIQNICLNKTESEAKEYLFLCNN